MRFVSLWLSAVVLAVFALQQLFSAEPFLLIGSAKFSEPWRLVTSIFAHANAAHLLSNLFALNLFGLILEGRIGARRVLLLFLVAGLIVNLFSPYPRSLGASGAVYALIGALAVLRPFMVIYAQFLPMPMVVAALFYLLQDIFGVFYPTGVANLAHISGLFIGVVSGLAWRRKFGDSVSLPEKRERNPVLERQLDEFERRHMLRK